MIESKELLLCRSDGSIVYTSDGLEDLLRLPGARSAARRSLAALLSTSAILDGVAVEEMLSRIQREGFQQGSHLLKTERGVPPLLLQIKSPADDQWVLTFCKGGLDDPEEASGFEELALTDSLTSLHNRRYFVQVVRDAVTAGRMPMAVLILDLDRFKLVNDTLGHPIGDQLLRKTAERLRSAVAQQGFLARLGGDEFAVFFPAATLITVESLAAKIVELLSRPFLIEGYQVNIGTSIGVVLIEDGEVTYERLMKNADLALYAAKAEGRGRFRLFHQSMEDAANARRLLEIDLRKALVLRQFEAHYQPWVNVESGHVFGLQAVLRWRHPQRGLLSEELYMPLAAEIGLVASLNNWLLEAACQTAATLTATARVSVSVVAEQFTGRESLVTIVQQALQATGLAAHRLELSVTEECLLKHEETIVGALLKLRARGVRVVMNDFGVGYASLSKLTSFPFDRIKIAPSFVHDHVWSASHRAVIHAVAALGTCLGIETLVDGVCTKDELAQVRRAGGETLQGCRLDPALPISELNALYAPPAAEESLQSR